MKDEVDENGETIVPDCPLCRGLLPGWECNGCSGCGLNSLEAADDFFKTRNYAAYKREQNKRKIARLLRENNHWNLVEKEAEENLIREKEYWVYMKEVGRKRLRLYQKKQWAIINNHHASAEDKKTAEENIDNSKTWEMGPSQYGPAPPTFEYATWLSRAKFETWDATWSDHPKGNFYREKRDEVQAKIFGDINRLREASSRRRAKVYENIDNVSDEDMIDDYAEETETDEETVERRRRNNEMRDTNEESSNRRTLMSSSSDREVIVDVTGDEPVV
ncbi:hypothetical protein RFI_35568, partial [Reticulomyxa filosa]